MGNVVQHVESHIYRQENIHIKDVKYFIGGHYGCDTVRCGNNIHKRHGIKDSTCVQWRNGSSGAMIRCKYNWSSSFSIAFPHISPVKTRNMSHYENTFCDFLPTNLLL